jgi:hypothetical protein
MLTILIPVTLSACILITVSFSRNPLLQRASTVAQHDVRFSGTTTLRAAHKLDPSLLVSQLANGSIDVFLPPLLEALRGLHLKQGITIPGVECHGQCKTKVKVSDI